MPKGPQGQKRPADANSRAVMIARIATGEIEDTTTNAVKAKAGKAGGAARNAALSGEERSVIATEAARKRWLARDKP